MATTEEKESSCASSAVETWPAERQADGPRHGQELGHAAQVALSRRAGSYQARDGDRGSHGVHRGHLRSPPLRVSTPPGFGERVRLVKLKEFLCSVNCSAAEFLHAGAKIPSLSHTHTGAVIARIRRLYPTRLTSTHHSDRSEARQRRGSSRQPVFRGSAWFSLPPRPRPPRLRSRRRRCRCLMVCRPPGCRRARSRRCPVPVPVPPPSPPHCRSPSAEA